MITKTAINLAPEKKPETPRVSTPILDTAALLGGGLLAKKQFQDGNLTGRATLYHGSLKDRIDAIRHTGLNPSTEANAINTNVLRGRPEIFREALGKSYLTPDPMRAAMYATASKKRILGDNNLTRDMLGELKQSLSQDTVAKFNIPTWQMKTTKNPETAMGFDKWYDNLSQTDKILTPKNAHKATFHGLDNEVVIDGGVPTKYIKGSKDYKRLSPKELLSYLVNNKKRAAKGVGLAGVGVSLSGLGLKRILTNKNNHSQDDNFMITKTANSLITPTVNTREAMDLNRQIRNVEDAYNSHRTGDIMRGLGTTGSLLGTVAGVTSANPSLGKLIATGGIGLGAGMAGGALLGHSVQKKRRKILDDLYDKQTSLTKNAATLGGLTGTVGGLYGAGKGLYNTYSGDSEDRSMSAALKNALIGAGVGTAGGVAAGVAGAPLVNRNASRIYYKGFDRMGNNAMRGKQDVTNVEKSINRAIFGGHGASALAGAAVANAGVDRLRK